MWSRVKVVAIIAVAVMFGNGCGSLTVKIGTEIFASGRGVRELQMTASGIFIGMLASMAKEAENDGSAGRYYADESGAHLTLVLECDFRRDSAQLGQNVDELLRRATADFDQDTPFTSPEHDLQVRIVDHLFTTEYHYRETYPARPEGSRLDRCSSCDGTGKVSCPLCDGTGWSMCWKCLGSGTEYNYFTLERNRCLCCGGSGRVVCSSCAGSRHRDCFSCGGTGKPSGWDTIALDLVESMFDATNIVRMPGRIVDHNGTLRDDQTVNWPLGLRAFDRGVTMWATSVRTKYELIAVLALIVLALGGGGWYLHWSRLPLDPYSAPDADGYDAQGGAPLPPVEGHAQATLVEEQDDDYAERPSPAAAAQEIARSRKEEAAEAFSLLGQGVRCYKRRRFPEALEALQMAVILAPKEARAWRYLSAAYFELGEYEQAIAAARRVVRLTPDDPVALCNLGTVLRKAGKLGQARAYQLRTRRLAPDYRRARVELAKLDRLERDAQDDDG
jgi:hypothetical protein